MCLALGVEHPDYLLPQLTWEQWLGWRAYYQTEPWGEERADSRAAANSMWTVATQHGGEAPDLLYPYFRDAGELWRKHQELEAKQDDAARAAKLKAAREAYWKAKKEREGK